MYFVKVQDNFILFFKLIIFKVIIRRWNIKKSLFLDPKSDRYFLNKIRIKSRESQKVSHPWVSCSFQLRFLFLCVRCSLEEKCLKNWWKCHRKQWLRGKNTSIVPSTALYCSFPWKLRESSEKCLKNYPAKT